MTVIEARGLRKAFGHFFADTTRAARNDSGLA